jgi:hypothetical protein
VRILFTVYIAMLAHFALAASWAPLVNLAPGRAGTMLLLTDGSVMVHDGGQGWMRLTPDIHGNYLNGNWTSDITPMSIPRLYFASQVLPDGRVWILGGEYSGPKLQEDDSALGEIYDPVLNSWSPILSYPSQYGCPSFNTTGNTSIGSTIITGIPSTANLQIGWPVTGTPIPRGTTLSSIDSDTQVQISQAATASSAAAVLQFNRSVRPTACFGDVPTMLLPSGQILAGDLINNSTYIYDVASNSWRLVASKIYNDRSSEEGWVKLDDGTILTYDIFESVVIGKGFAERYNPATNTWSSVSPGDGTAAGVLPLLTSGALGHELGPALRLHDGRVFEIGANGHTALYTPATNSWAAGPDILDSVSGGLFGADDAPAAITPNGHVLFAADTGPQGVISSGDTNSGSSIITGIPSTAGLRAGWVVTGKGIPSNARIFSVDSPSQIQMTLSATDTNIGVTLQLGGPFSNPTLIFDFDPSAGIINAVSPAFTDPNLLNEGAYRTRMLVLPTGQVLFSDNGRQLWIYTPDGPVNPALRPVINQVAYTGAGNFTLTGWQLNGQSAGSAYGDDVQSDENYPIVRLINSSGNVYYSRTTNWSSVGVGMGSGSETVNFRLNSALTPGNYSLVVSGAGMSSYPISIHISQGEVLAQ